MMYKASPPTFHFGVLREWRGEILLTSGQSTTPAHELANYTLHGTILKVLHYLRASFSAYPELIEGSRAEFENRIEDARRLNQQAWQARKDDYDACIAAHYVAHFQENPEETLRWNQIASDHANAVKDEWVREFHPSLYLNMGRSYEGAWGCGQRRKVFTVSRQSPR
ncbi:MAG: hypothetical protein MZV64_23045 [Ignavibacteriales bacterium]|nr:hypothetical protein [Ignavibacteriales bacterium]